MTTIQSVLDEFGSGLTEPDLARWLHEQLTRSGRSASVALTDAERDALLVHGGVDPEDLQPVTPTAAVQRQAVTAIDMARSTMSVAEAADLLHLDPTRIRHRIGDKTLFGRKIGRTLRLSRWQFDGGKPLPGLPVVIAALPAGLHLLEVQMLMTTEQPDLSVADHPTTPRDWLLAGRPVEAVAQIAASLAQW